MEGYRKNLLDIFLKLYDHGGDAIDGGLALEVSRWPEEEEE